MIVESEDWKDEKEYHLQKCLEIRKHSSSIVSAHGLYNDTLHSLVREYIETAKLELRHEFSDVDSPEAKVAALQVTFKNITSMLHKLICIKLAAGGFDTDLLQKMAKAKEEQLSEVRKRKDLLYEQLLKEQEEKHRAQEAENRVREAEREDKEVARAARAARKKRVEDEERARRKLEDPAINLTSQYSSLSVFILVFVCCKGLVCFRVCCKKPTFAKRVIKTSITWDMPSWLPWSEAEAEAVDVKTGIKATGMANSEDLARKRAMANLKTKLLEQGIICQD